MLSRASKLRAVRGAVRRCGGAGFAQEPDVPSRVKEGVALFFEGEMPGFAQVHQLTTRDAELFLRFVAGQPGDRFCSLVSHVLWDRF